MKIYIAGASAEIERAEQWRDKLVAEGHTVTSTWMAQIRQVGAANPREVTKQQRKEWTWKCLREVEYSDVLWFLVPPVQIATRGSWGELVAAALNLNNKLIVCSGDTWQSIFCALDREFSTDDHAFHFITRMVEIDG